MISIHVLFSQVTNVATSIVDLTKAAHVPTNRVQNKAIKTAAKAAAAHSLKAVGAGPLASAAAAGPLPSVAAAPVPAQPLASAAGSTGEHPDQAEAMPSPAAVSGADRDYLAAHDQIQADYAGFQQTGSAQDHSDARWVFMCDAAPRGLLSRSYHPWAQTGSVKFATWWEIVQFDGFVYMLRGVLSLRFLVILRNLCAVLRLACRGESALGQPARVPMGLDARAVRAVIAFEDATPISEHIHALHVIIHLVRPPPPPPPPPLLSAV